MKTEPLVSVVIPTFNSEKTIKICLESIRKQTFRGTEVIIVDNFSQDKTVEIAKEYEAKIIVESLGMSAARNRGLKETRGKYILSVDSDMIITKNVIEECVKLISKNEKLGGIIIPERSVGNSFWVAIRDFERSFYAGTEMESARFFKKTLMKEVGGYDEAVTFFEDSTLPQKIEKLGYNVKARISSDIFHYEGNFSLKWWLKKKFYYGKTRRLYETKYKDYASKQLAISSRLLLFFKDKNFYMKPLLASGVILLKLLEFSFAGLGFLANKSKRLDKAN